MAKPIRLGPGNIPVEQDVLFTELGDAPSTYAGKAGQYVRVNAAETGLEIATADTWTMADLAYPPPVWIDPSVASTVVTPTGSTILTSVASQFNPTTMVGTAGATVNLIRAAPMFGGLPAMSFSGGSTSVLTIGGALGVLRNKGGATLIALGWFTGATLSAVIVYVGTNTPNTLRAAVSVATDDGTRLRMAGRRLDADASAMGVNVGGPQGSGTITGSPFLAIFEYDYANAIARGYLNGELIHTITPFQTAGLSSNTDSDVVRLAGASSGSNAPIMLQCAGISDTIYSTADRQRIEGHLLWRARLQGLLPGTHPYAGSAPLGPTGLSFAEAMSLASLEP